MPRDAGKKLFHAIVVAGAAIGGCAETSTPMPDAGTAANPPIAGSGGAPAASGAGGSATGGGGASGSGIPLAGIGGAGGGDVSSGTGGSADAGKSRDAAEPEPHQDAEVMFPHITM